MNDRPRPDCYPEHCAPGTPCPRHATPTEPGFCEPCGSWECGHDAALVQALILMGVDYSTAEDKAFMAKEAAAMNAAHGALEATEKALALYLGVDVATANELILSATD